MIFKIYSHQLMYSINVCSPIYDTAQDGSISLRATRILFGIDLLVLCISYNLVSFFMKRNINDFRLQDKESNQPKIELLQLQYKRWEQQYLLSFGDHIVAVGFAMIFSPFQFQLILAFIFLISKIVNQVKVHKFSSHSKQFKTLFRIINMALLICAMVGLSRTGFDDSGCIDSTFTLN